MKIKGSKFFFNIPVVFVILLGILISINRLILMEQHMYDGFFNHRYFNVKFQTLIHIISGIIYLVIAPIQLSKKARQYSIQWHRFLGRICLSSGLTLGIASAIMQFKLAEG